MSTPHTKEDKTELIPIQVGKGLESSLEYVSIGATLGVKARIHMDNRNNVCIVAEKMTFINTKSNEDDE